MAENTLGQRMRAAADAAGLKQEVVGAEVAKRLGRKPFSAAAVGQWYADKHKPNYLTLVEFSILTNADLIWLQTGVGRGTGQLPREGRPVPTITMEQAIATPIEYATNEMVHTYFPCSDKAFIVKIADDRNVKDGLGYLVGYKVVIDPTRKPRPGKMVLAVINREPIFGKYTEKTGKAIVIEALNPSWPTEILNPKKGDRIVGTMTEFAAPAP